MIDSDDIEQMLDRLREFPQRLTDIIDDRDQESLTRAAADGGWGAVEIFCHLRDTEELFVERVERILTEDEPYIQAVDATLWPIEREYDQQQPRIALEQFAQLRARFVGMLAPLDASQWHRRGFHSEDGEQTVLGYAGHHVSHDAEHEQQLVNLLQHV